MANESQITALARLINMDHVTIGTYNQWRAIPGPGNHYEDEPIADVSDIGYGRWDSVRLSDARTWTPDTVPANTIAVLERTTYSDYSGSTCERANHKAIADDCAKVEWLHEVYGGHGTAGLAIDVRAWLADIHEDNDDPCNLLATLDGLTDYPVVSDDLLSEIEHEIETEYLPDLYRDLARKVCYTRHPHIQQYLEDMPEDRAFACYRQAMDETNTYPEFETGGTCYIDADRIWPAYLRAALSRRHDAPGTIE